MALTGLHEIAGAFGFVARRFYRVKHASTAAQLTRRSAQRCCDCTQRRIFSLKSTDRAVLRLVVHASFISLNAD
jgi:hypothetical protein